MDSENDEEEVVPYKTKYRQLKSRLKYLIYEHECFENDIQKAQMKLLELSSDKNFLLDQLMRYEAVVLSGGEETDYSSGEETPSHPPPLPPPPEKTEIGVKSEAVDQSASLSSSSSACAAASTTKSAAATVGGGGGGGGVVRNTATVIHNTTSDSTTTTSATKTASTLTVKSGGVQKATKAASTKVSAMAAAKITKAVARARQGPQQHSPTTIIVSTSPLIVSLPIGTASGGGGWGKLLQQATPLATPLIKHTPQIMSLSSGVSAQSTTAAILASIPAPAKPPRPKPLLVPSTATRPSGKGTPPVGVVKWAGSHHQGASSSSSSTSSSDSEDSASESSTSGSSRDDEDEEGSAMDTGGPVPIVHSVPVPAGAPQLLRPKAILSPVKAPPPKLISMSEHPTGGVGGGPTSSPLSSTPPVGGARRFLWSSRAGEAMPSLGFVSIAPLASPTSLSKPYSGSAFQLVASPPGSAPLARPPSLQDLSGVEPGNPRPPP
ncbi:INO80 complex subunit E [Geodia barretti]|uniref:INO80 complex subunit E n=1 Tax=Geodia barretti TaxID=519541 RepID=A0AA35WYP6_GEOBA|nr:INO80 complex subunit E [Geodia barretti]